MWPPQRVMSQPPIHKRPLWRKNIYYHPPSSPTISILYSPLPRAENNTFLQQVQYLVNINDQHILTNYNTIDKSKRHKVNDGQKVEFGFVKVYCPYTTESFFYIFLFRPYLLPFSNITIILIWIMQVWMHVCTLYNYIYTKIS